MNFFKLNFKILNLIILISFSFLVNLYYSSIGSFPIDTFLHYDSSARILKGELPIRDFWIVSGIVIDFIQFLFFKIFGVNWYAYVIHSSVFNCIISLLIYFYFLSINLDRSTSLLCACCFSTLAYTVSGTPFVDHHAIFFALISNILIIRAINLKKNYLWFFAILFFFLSFLTKQVPASYIILTQAFLLGVFILKEKKFDQLKYIFLSSVILVLLLLIFLFFLNIQFKDFFIQYIVYPLSIGSGRINNLNLNLNTFFNNYKFILLPLFLTLMLKVYRYRYQKLNFLNKDFYVFLLISFFVFSSIFHQVMTKNQIYIYFFVPIFCGIFLSELKITNYKYKNLFTIISIIFLILVTLKYHVRYNENRKFHELEKANLAEASEAKKIDKSLQGLKWMNPLYENSPDEEILKIKKGKKILENINDEIMVITHYLFLDSITKKNLNYPARTFTSDGISLPVKGSKYFKKYQNFLLGKIKKKNIKKIYFFKHEGIYQTVLTDYLSPTCFNLSEDEIFNIVELKCFELS